MFSKDVCPRCKTVISEEETRALRKAQRKGGTLGLVLGLLGAGVGVYFGMTV